MINGEFFKWWVLMINGEFLWEMVSSYGKW